MYAVSEEQTGSISRQWLNMVPIFSKQDYRRGQTSETPRCGSNSHNRVICFIPIYGICITTRGSKLKTAPNCPRDIKTEQEQEVARPLMHRRGSRKGKRRDTIRTPRCYYI